MHQLSLSGYKALCNSVLYFKHIYTSQQIQLFIVSFVLGITLILVSSGFHLQLELKTFVRFYTRFVFFQFVV